MPIKSGSQFLINTFANSDQEELSLAGLANGLFVGAYNAGVPFGNGDGIKFQVFNADGTKRGAETTLTSATQFTTLVTRDPDVAAAPDASFYIAGDVGTSGVNGGRHTNIDLNSLPNSGIGFGPGLENEVAIAVRSDGVRLGVFQSSTSPAGPTDPNIRASVFSPLHPTGVGENGEFVNSNLPGVQTRPDVAALTGGRFVAVWEAGPLAVAFRFIDVTYGPDPNLPAPAPTVALMNQVGVDTIVNQNDARHPVVAALPGDRFVVLWYHPLAADRAQILGRVYDSSGNSLGDFVAANNNVAFQELQTDRDIAVAVSPNGQFMVAWTGLAGTPAADTSGTYIEAAVFNSNGIPGTNSFSVVPAGGSGVLGISPLIGSLTTITSGNQFDPSVAALADGRFVLGWTDASTSADDTSGLAVRGQIFDTRTIALTINGTSGHDDFVGTDFVNTGFGNDTFNTGAGNDTLNGGAGVDSARFSGPRSAYTVEELGNGRVVVTGPDGLDSLTSIETLIFDDMSLTLNVNQAPIITFGGGGDSATLGLKENQLAVATIGAFDADFDPLTFAIVGGPDQARFQLDSGGHLRFLVAPNFEAPTDADGNRSYIVQVRVTAAGQSDTQTITVNITDQIREPATPLDFNGEGTSDILLRRADGTLLLDLIDNLHVGSAAVLGPVGSELHESGIGDFDNDRDSDLLLRNDAGTFFLLRFQAGQVQSAISVGQVGNDWQVAGNGDFDGDGDRDLLTRHDDGTFFRYTFEAGQVQSAASLGQVGNELSVAGIGDFDGDGDADLLLRHDDGNFFLYRFQAGQVQSSESLGQVGNELQAAGAGDFDNDGDSDLLMRGDDGTLFLFQFQSGQVQSASSLGQVGSDWQVARVGDYDGDGDFDLLLRQNENFLAYEIEAGRVQSTVNVGAIGVDWQVL